MDCIFDTGDDMIEVLKQALDALETEVSIDWTNNDEFNASAEKMHDAITSLRQAIKELESQEPVAWKETDEVECPVCRDKGFPWPKCGHITYLERINPSQRTWVGLTDEIPKGVLLAISNAGLTLVKTQHGYELRKLGPVVAHDIKG